MSEVARIDLAGLRADWALPEPAEHGSKHDRGTAVVIGGAASTPGAVLLAGLAALRVGAGRLTIGTVAATAGPLAVAVPEAGVTGLLSTPSGGLGGAAAAAAGELADSADALLLGPGMTGPDDALELATALLDGAPGDATIVLDALAVTCGTVELASLERRSGQVVITPNATEAEYLVDSADAPEPDVAREVASRYGVVTVLGSAIASPDGRCWVTTKGNNGLATSGSGDVLAGIIVGLAARGASPLQAALWGVTLHSAAGDRLAHRVGAIGFLARELLVELPDLLAA